MYKILIFLLTLALSSCATVKDKEPKVTEGAPATIEVWGAKDYCKRKPESPLCQDQQ